MFEKLVEVSNIQFFFNEWHFGRLRILLQKLQLSMATEQYKLPEIRDTFSFMIYCSLNCKVLLKYIQEAVDIIVTYQIP